MIFDLAGPSEKSRAGKIAPSDMQRLQKRKPSLYLATLLGTTCCNMLDDIGSNLKRSIFFGCCMILYSRNIVALRHAR